MRPAWMLLIVLASCGPAPSVPPPRAPRCLSLERAIIGTWTRDGSAMELRVDGAIMRDSIEGAFRWASPGHATIDIRGAHEEHTMGLVTIATLLDIDANGHALHWARVSPPPTIPDGCYDVRGSVIGHWTDGATEETFDADGTYSRGSHRGTWQMVEVGTIDLIVDRSAPRRYRVALASPTTLVSAPTDVPDPIRGALVESRLP